MNFMKKFMRKLTNPEIFQSSLLKILISLFGLFGVFRGYTWKINPEQVLKSAPVYETVNRAMSIENLGLLFLLGGLTTIIGAITMGRWSYLLLTAGGLISLPGCIVMYYAALLDGANAYTAQSVGIITAFNIVIIVSGGIFWWIERKNQNT